MRTVPALMLATLLAGCDPCATECAALEGSTVAIELGQGEASFSPIEDGDTLDLIAGPQGGVHVVVALQGTGFLAGDVADRTGPCSPEIDLTLTTDVGVSDSWNAQPLVFTSVGDKRVVVNQFLTLDIFDGNTADGVQATLGVSLSDACGHSATDTRVVELSYTPPT